MTRRNHKIFWGEKSIKKYCEEFADKHVDDHHCVACVYSKLLFLPIYILEKLNIAYVKN